MVMAPRPVDSASTAGDWEKGLRRFHDRGRDRPSGVRRSRLFRVEPRPRGLVLHHRSGRLQFHVRASEIRSGRRLAGREQHGCRDDAHRRRGGPHRPGRSQDDPGARGVLRSRRLRCAVRARQPRGNPSERSCEVSDRRRAGIESIAPAFSSSSRALGPPSFQGIWSCGKTSEQRQCLGPCIARREFRCGTPCRSACWGRHGGRPCGRASSWNTQFRNHAGKTDEASLRQGVLNRSSIST